MSAKRHKVTGLIAGFVFAVFAGGCGSQPQEQPVAATKGTASDEPLANPNFAPPKLEFQKTAESIAPQPAFTLPKEAETLVERWIAAIGDKNSDALVSMMRPPWLESNGAILQTGEELANAARTLMDECRGARLTVKESYPFSDPRAHELSQRLKIIVEQNPKSQIAPPGGRDRARQNDRALPQRRRHPQTHLDAVSAPRQRRLGDGRQ